ncbi:hypothetical protein [Asticcacaulis solisilvae]|uniref:hypothetical protein n=1 Tax=Asticcacaulis solisilvae TaxID=1217274 RepID=UPI003FD7D30D
MIEDLAVSKTATFFSIKRKLSNKSLEDMFVALRLSYGVTTNNLFKHTRVASGAARWSAISFLYESPPSFLGADTAIRETLCGYLMLVEYEGHVAIFSSRISLPSSFKSTHLAQIPIAKIENAIAKADAVFHRMRMRNMSVSPFAMRNKTLEAKNLANVVGPAGSRRYAPQAYTVEVGGNFSTATPSTGRIGIRSDRVGHDELLGFAQQVIDGLRSQPGQVSTFISSFARPVSLEDTLAECQPVTMAIDTNRLVEEVAGEAPTVRLVRGGENRVELSADELTALFNYLDRPVEITGNDRLRKIIDPVDAAEVGSISVNKSRIALRSLTQPPASDVQVESLEFGAGADPNPRSLQKYLDEIDAPVILFDNVRYAYIDGQVFRDETLLDGGASILRYCRTEALLAQVTSEKGNFAPGQAVFDATSTFGVIVNEIGNADTTLICDDLGDEWADFIGIRVDNNITHINFYHAKHGPLSLGAGPFHVAISQAIKNLGNMTFPEDRMVAKIQGWSTTYNAPGQVTQIPRICRTNSVDLNGLINEARLAPESLRRATIVTSSLSKKALKDAFELIKNGQRPTPSFVQLYWLLQSFFSACSEVGATGAIVCQP